MLLNVGPAVWAGLSLLCCLVATPAAIAGLYRKPGTEMSNPQVIALLLCLVFYPLLVACLQASISSLIRYNHEYQDRQR
jgi:hypothetical protein